MKLEEVMESVKAIGALREGLGLMSIQVSTQRDMHVRRAHLIRFAQENGLVLDFTDFVCSLKTENKYEGYIRIDDFRIHALFTQEEYEEYMESIREENKNVNEAV